MENTPVSQVKLEEEVKQFNFNEFDFNCQRKIQVNFSLYLLLKYFHRPHRSVQNSPKNKCIILLRKDHEFIVIKSFKATCHAMGTT